MNLFSLFATITLDTKSYERGVNDAVAKGKSASNTLSASFANGAKKIGSALASMAKVGAAAFAGLATLGVKYNSEMENYTTNFEVMLGSQEEAVKKVEELKKMAAETPFEMSDLASATQTLLAFSVNADDSSKIMKQLGDISLGNKQKFESLTRAYGKMNAAQKVTLEDLNIMIDSGFNPLLLISEKTGESMTDLYKRVSDGKVSFNEIQEAIADATSEGGQFFQGMEKGSKTLSGQLSTLKDNAMSLLGELTSGLFGTLTKDLVPRAIAVLDELQTAYETDGFEGMFRTGKNLAGKLIDGIEENGPELIESGINAVSDFILGISKEIPNIMKKATSIVGEFAKTIAENSGEMLTAAVELIGAIGSGLIDSIGIFAEDAPEIIAGIGQGLIDAGGALLETGEKLMGKIFDGIKTAAENLPEWLENLPTTIFDKFEQNTMQEVEFAQNLPAEIFAFFKPKVMQEVEFVKDLPGIIGNFFRERIDEAKQGAKDLADGIVSFFQELPTRIGEWLGTAFRKIYDWNESVVNTFKELPSKIWNWIQSIPGMIGGLFEGLANNIGSFFEDLPSKLYQIGKDMITNLWNGIKSYIGWFKNQITGFAQGLWSGFFGGDNNPPKTVTPQMQNNGFRIDGSYAKGLNYVPFDGFIAELHKGEMVLTKDQAESYRNETAQPGITVVQNIYSEAKTAADLMREALFEQERAVLIGV